MVKTSFSTVAGFRRTCLFKSDSLNKAIAVPVGGYLMQTLGEKGVRGFTARAEFAKLPLVRSILAPSCCELRQ
jgi:hypothetical protein